MLRSVSRGPLTPLRSLRLRGPVAPRRFATYLSDAISSRSLPRSRATAAGDLRHSSPLKVARTTLCGLAEPSDLVSTLCSPAASTTARTAPPAIMPVPSGAGFSSTLPDPNFPTMACGIVVPASGTRINPFFAASIPFLMAEGTSFALPTPKPTTPWPSPTTTSALKLRFLPPFTTFVTRLIDTTVSLMSSCDGSIFSRVRCIVSLIFQSANHRICRFTSELQPCFAGRVGDRLNPAVIEVAVAVEDHLGDALVLEPLRDRLADELGAGLVAAARLLVQSRFQRGLRGCRRR